MVKLIILRGNSGSGKTTIAKELQRKFGENTMLISQDVIRSEGWTKYTRTATYKRAFVLWYQPQ